METITVTALAKTKKETTKQKGSVYAFYRNL